MFWAAEPGVDVKPPVPGHVCLGRSMTKYCIKKKRPGERLLTINRGEERKKSSTYRIGASHGLTGRRRKSQGDLVTWVPGNLGSVSKVCTSAMLHQWLAVGL